MFKFLFFPNKMFSNKFYSLKNKTVLSPGCVTSVTNTLSSDQKLNKMIKTKNSGRTDPVLGDVSFQREQQTN
ncbi:hypothetical protein EXN66_Car014130 [Channa argus]|uniref:Uncharacterized protein n=1 Tax=Channa argus TaxID=215402 RepID=A0A6G1Q7Q7_CHAAH|nr:hypothetical protein EXN66_Car014130 [Channa argus]